MAWTGLMAEISLNSRRVCSDQTWSRRSSSLNAASGFQMSCIVHLNAPNEDPSGGRRCYLLPQRYRCLIVHVAWHEGNPSNLLPPGFGTQLKYFTTLFVIYSGNK